MLLIRLSVSHHTPVVCCQAAPGDGRDYYRPTYLRHGESPRVFLDLLLAHRCCSPSRPHPILIAPTYCSYGDKRLRGSEHVQTWFTSLGQKVPDPQRSLDHVEGFFSARFNRRIPRHFLVPTNAQELGIDCLDIPSFMPRIRQYFGHFLPSVCSP